MAGVDIVRLCECFASVLNLTQILHNHRDTEHTETIGANHANRISKRTVY